MFGVRKGEAGPGTCEKDPKRVSASMQYISIVNTMF